MFILTRQEQRTIAFIVLVVILGLLTQHYRHRQVQPAPPPNEAAEVTPAPNPPAPPE
ncbi:MAG: hypothetical protein ABIR29_14830 [Chthoniobacterales bacterium]